MKKMALVVLLLFLFPMPAVGGELLGHLLVFTSEYCPYCKEFMKVVAPFYPKTAIGRQLPLTEVDNFDAPEEFEALAWEIRFVPTFLIMDRSGKELARFYGYRGEEFFWGELESVLNQLGLLKKIQQE